MRNASNTVETINAAAVAIISAEARVQPTTIHKRRWRSCWGLHLCFGFHRNSKRIGHAVLISEPVVSGPPASSAPNIQPPPSIILPFTVPPSSPASFLQSDPPSITQSPTKLLSLASLSARAHSPGGPASMFAIGPYAYETQLVSPPVFSTFTTEPSTAAFTPPPESVQMTTPSSPEVPFAQLLASSLERARRNGGTNPKFALSQGEFQPYQGGQILSPGSAVSNSGTSSPFPDKRPRVFGLDHFSTRKWGSRLGSGTLTPDGTGVRSRLGSGSLTPDGAGFRSRLGSGCLTPDGLGTPCQESVLVDDPIAEVVSVFNSDNGSKHDEDDTVTHRVSFEVTGDVARCLESKPAASFRSLLEFPEAELTLERENVAAHEGPWEFCIKECTGQQTERASGETGNVRCCQKQHSFSLSSAKEFNFDSTNTGNLPSKTDMSSEWWVNEKEDVEEAKTRSENSWSFFPLLQPEVS